MRKIFTLLLLLTGFAATAQQFNNEWIQFSQTYYKIKIANDGVYRIPKSLLDAMGIGGAQVQNFELWRNGEKVPFYPSISSGVLPGNGYLEFWGEKNDGKPDRVLYRQPEFQHTTKYSLQTDTAIYFLSVSNTTTAGFRYTDVTNNAGSSSLPVEPYLMYTFGHYYVHTSTKAPNMGLAAMVGVPVYSSSYDQGEVFASNEITAGNTLTTPLSGFNVYPAGPQSTLKFGAVGVALNTRNIKVRVNNVEVKDTVMNYFNDLVTTAPVDNNSINTGGTITFQFQNASAAPNDRMVASFLELTYPRNWDMNGASNFKFTLPAKSSGYLLHITNFNYSAAPVLYDTKNGERYVADISTGGVVKFALPGLNVSRELVLVSEDGGNINTVTSFTTRNFTDYRLAANQGDYLIITNPILYTGSAGNNPVDDYKNYRQSATGGSYKVLVADINELTDQFAFGIKGHPLSVRNFVRYARTKFTAIKHVFLIGRGMNYSDFQKTQRYPGSFPLGDQLNLVPTFGNPGSDNLLVVDDPTVPVPAIPIGRLSVVRGSEVENYLEKVKEYEQAQKNAPNTVAGRSWMKNVVHVTGSSDSYLGTVLCNYMEMYQQIIEDTLFGADVHTFCKTSTNPVEQVSPEKIAKLFQDGITFLTYFGHSSATTLEFNIDNPENYNNQGKYPVFFVNGCKAGDFFTYYPDRFVANETLSEKFTLAKQRGSIAFVASTHFGIVNYLNLYLTGLYENMARTYYDKSLGETMKGTIQQLINATGSYDFYSRMHAEQMALHGDPAIFLNVQNKPDYVVEDQLIYINPAFISVAETKFTVKAKVMNLGKAPADSIVFEIKRQYPDGSIDILYREKIRGIGYADSVTLKVPIITSRDKGLNKIIVTIDADNVANEISESNNSFTKQFYIYENDARPVYPYAYAIIHNPTQTLYASTSNPLTESRSYVAELDTTGFFNSSFKVTKTLTGPGGILEFNPGIVYKDSTVYYWRIAAVPDAGGQYQWITSSFMYINSNVDGFAQADFYQNLNSETERVTLDSTSRLWKYGTRTNYLQITTSTWAAGAVNEQDVQVDVNGNTIAHNFCAFHSVAFIVLDPVTFKPWKNNYDPSTGAGQYGSWSNCYTGRDYNFEFRYTDTASRARMRNFMENVIPDGHFVIARSALLASSPPIYAADWANDTTYYGQYNSIYHSFLKYGCTEVDSFSRQRQFIFVYKKNDSYNFTPVFTFTRDNAHRQTMTTVCITPDTIGYISSPVFGPAKKWHEVNWQGVSQEDPSPDNPSVEVVGITDNNVETVLYSLDKNTHTFDVSGVDVSQYPYMRLRMRNIDSVKLTPYQLKSWRIHYDPVPEGSMAGNIYLKQIKDTFNLGETASFGIAFKNVSKTAFADSIKVKAVVIDQSNVSHDLFIRRQKRIISGDTIIVVFDFNTTSYPGSNLLFVDVNTGNDQREQYFFNNFVYKNFYVRTDNKNPLLDVTFDGVHILNRDIVSAKPHVQIKLKDESEYLLLNDTSLVTVQVQYPNGSLRTYNFDGDTLRFVPATSGSDNTATIEFTPQFLKQINPEGDVYELIIKAKDKSGNKASDIAYRVAFTVISKPMISNILNYPNPFSTSTAFVFTLTGSTVPQNVRIQILTVTGKIVREITTNELGPLHIGRNITEFKWDGTDQYGQKLGNGVYLYRVITSLDGKTMDKYKAQGDNTDQYFNNGYGKMYLMR
jgi:hypothetical protein